MNPFSRLIRLVSESDLRPYSLVRCAIATGNEFSILALSGKPYFQIVLLCRNSPQVTRTHVDNSIGQVKELEQFLNILNHHLMFDPRFLGLREDELLNLFKLMYTEDPFCISTVSSSFFPETRTNSAVP